MTETPEEAKGIMFIATDKPISVGVEGTSTVVDKSVAGYYLVHKDDMKALIEHEKEYLAWKTSQNKDKDYGFHKLESHQ